MKYPHVAALAAFGLLAAAAPGHAQDSAFKGFLKRTAGAVMGQPTGASSVPNGSVSYGTTATDGPVFRPISPASGATFPGIFKGFTASNNTGLYPRVALTFETFGASEACWRTRATIWTSATNHREETFDLCNAPLVMTDDLGHTTTQQDPTLTLSIKMANPTFAPGVPISPERNTGPNPPRLPFEVSLNSAPRAALLKSQYKAIVARAMVITGYAGNTSMPQMWVGGFNPSGNRDEGAN